ncbi:MAG: bifunctional folylpolyglutamate synthase/dihydrofolate synthase [Chlorobi bacterium]|nr:bifunctional folylpolyglutamate synthase/dihydrofolate synthase [Chlorobiota bacterium]
MTYKEATAFLFEQLPMYQRQGKAAYKADLKTTLLLDEYFGHPHKKYKSIHIAGTNGKGSVAHMLASVLQRAGYKTGLYTSPHLKDFRERIRVNGICVPKEYVISFVTDNSNIIRQLKPSFFEMTVAMAFEYFKNEKVDFAVIETGLGGRLDSTNIISPELSVITNIGLDHTRFLGNTKKLIAKEKAGIIKPHTPVVTGETDPETIEVFRTVANKNSSPLIQADKLFSIPYSTFSADEKQIMQVYSNDKVVFSNLKVSLTGWYQKKNTVTALASISELIHAGYSIKTEHIYSGFENIQEITGLAGRWQIIGHNPKIICDTGHNEDGIKAVTEQLKNTPYKKLHIIWGMVNDKDYNTILKLLPRDALYYFTRASIPRSLDAETLQHEAKKHGLYGNYYPDVKTALSEAKKNASPNDLIFIGGSTFIVADVL